MQLQDGMRFTGVFSVPFVCVQEDTAGYGSTGFLKSAADWRPRGAPTSGCLPRLGIDEVANMFEKKKVCFYEA